MKEKNLQINRHAVKHFAVCAISVVCLVIAIVYAMDIKDLLWANENGKDMSEAVSYLDTLYNPQTTYRPSTDVDGVRNIAFCCNADSYCCFCEVYYRP